MVMTAEAIALARKTTNEEVIRSMKEDPYSCDVFKILCNRLDVRLHSVQPSPDIADVFSVMARLFEIHKPYCPLSNAFDHFKSKNS